MSVFFFMRRGDVSPLMWILLSMIVLLVIIGVLLAIKGKATGILDFLEGSW